MHPYCGNRRRWHCIGTCDRTTANDPRVIDCLSTFRPLLARVALGSPIATNRANGGIDQKLCFKRLETARMTGTHLELQRLTNEEREDYDLHDTYDADAS